MRYITHIIGLAALLLAIGCASTSIPPSGAQIVGGGLLIDWEAPVDGTAILVETTTGKTVATQSLAGSGHFEFDVGSQNDALKAIFPTMPNHAKFVLYFLPSAKKN